MKIVIIYKLENLSAALPPHPPRIQTWVLVLALPLTHGCVTLSKSLFAYEAVSPFIK